MDPKETETYFVSTMVNTSCCLKLCSFINRNMFWNLTSVMELLSTKVIIIHHFARWPISKTQQPAKDARKITTKEAFLIALILQEITLLILIK